MTTSKPKTQAEPEIRQASGEAAPEGPPRGGAFLLDPVVQPIFTREAFSDEQREIERMVLEFASERIDEVKDDLEAPNEELTMELMREVGELGLTSIDIPEEYGGLELDKATSALVVEALTTGGSASWCVTFSCHVGIGTIPIAYFGTEEQKKKYLPKLGTVEYLGAYALTEPDSGSDAAALKTTAKLTEDGKSFVLNGTKPLFSYPRYAGVLNVHDALETQLEPMKNHIGIAIVVDNLLVPLTSNYVVQLNAVVDYVCTHDYGGAPALNPGSFLFGRLLAGVAKSPAATFCRCS